MTHKSTNASAGQGLSAFLVFILRFFGAIASAVGSFMLLALQSDSQEGGQDIDLVTGLQDGGDYFSASEAAAAIDAMEQST